MGSQVLELVSQKGCAMSLLGDAQNPWDAAGPEQPAPAEPAGSRGLEQMVTRGACQPQPFLRFWELWGDGGNTRLAKIEVRILLFPHTCTRM